jgi:hypothetical protein
VLKSKSPGVAVTYFSYLSPGDFYHGNKIQCQYTHLTAGKTERNTSATGKVEKDEKLTPDEVAYFGELGWLSAAAVAIAAIAVI